MRLVISSANIAAWKAFVQISKNVSQHCCFYLQANGMYTQAMDGSQTALYDAWFPKDWFAQYTYDPATDPPSVMVYTDHLMRVMATLGGSAATSAASASATSGISLEASPDRTRLVLSVLVEDQRQAAVFELPLLDIDSELITVENKECSIHMSMSAKALYDLVHEHSTFGEKTTFLCNQTRLALVTSGEVTQKNFLHIKSGDAGIADFVSEADYAYKLTYSTKLLERMLQFYKFCVVNNHASAKAHVSFDDNHPFTVKYTHVNTTDVSTSSMGAGGTEARTAYVRIYIAPMVDTDNVDTMAEDALDAMNLHEEKGGAGDLDDNDDDESGDDDDESGDDDDESSMDVKE